MGSTLSWTQGLWTTSCQALATAAAPGIPVQVSATITLMSSDPPPQTPRE
ncbi:hypothetical protein CYA_1276 [Synechococcus sp. JA-3-3Ab]|nr:hypothetical protein CYA_1276 [Synechococcus sp. JA-3-3Ab]